MIALLLFALSLHPATVQDDRYGKWNNGIGHSQWDLALPREQREKLTALWTEIGEDLETDQNELSGTYFKGGDSGFFLRWSVKKGFVVIPYWDQSLITDFGYGTVKFLNRSQVIFNSEKQLKGGRGLGKMPRVWTAIWGHLSPVESLESFAQYRAGLGQYNDFNGNCCAFVPEFLVERIDREDHPLPDSVPEVYRRFIKDPISGKIFFVGKEKNVKDWSFDGHLYQQWIPQALLTTVKVDVGRDQGVKRNMLFRLMGEPPGQRYLQILRVSQKTAEGFVVQQVFEGTETISGQLKGRMPRVRIGTRVTTGSVID